LSGRTLHQPSVPCMPQAIDVMPLCPRVLHTVHETRTRNTGALKQCAELLLYTVNPHWSLTCMSH
jgi:hypothetical protein